ncbi:MAG: hypothetical protein AB7L66_21485 [Gemmatimonadales bacterium]
MTPTPIRTRRILVSLVVLSAGCGSGGTGPQPPAPPPPPPPPAPSIAMSLSLSGATVANGGLVPVTVTVTRAGGYTGAVTITVEGAPTGVSPAVSNVQTSGTTTTALVSITTGVNAAAGTYPLTIRAAGTGVSDATAVFNLTVAVGGSFGLQASPSSLSIARGASGASAIAIARLGGFSGTVTLTVDGVPSGVTATFDPAATTGTTSTLTVAVGTGAPVGTSNLTVRGNAAGQPERTVTIPLTINAAGGGSGVSFIVSCLNPLWAAYQDGDGAWTQVVPTPQGVHSFNLSANRGAFAFVYSAGSQTTISIIRMSRAEMTAAPQNYCLGTSSTKFVNASVSGLGAGDRAQISLGGASAFKSADGVFSLIGITAGPQDLVAFRTTSLASGGNPARGVIRRDLDPATATTLPGIDLNGAESFAAASAAITVPNFAAGETVATTMSYRSGASCAGASLYQAAGSGQAASPVGVLGIPAAVQRASDLHALTLTAITNPANPTATRVLMENFGALAPRTMTLPTALAAPAVTTLAGPYKRLQGVYPIPAEYTSGTSFTYISLSPIRAVTMNATLAWVGAGSATMAMPDFTGVTGWDNAWAPAAAATGTWAAQVTGSNITGDLCLANGRIVSADQRGTF